MLVCGVEVHNNGAYSDDDIKRYIRQAQEQVPQGAVSEMTLKPLDDGRIQIDYVAHYRKFERIRRITGYLVGTTDRWNNAKRQEERDRVKHAVQDKGQDS